jgi:hypothetical protein
MGENDAVESWEITDGHPLIANRDNLKLVDIFCPAQVGCAKCLVEIHNGPCREVIKPLNFPG